MKTVQRLLDANFIFELKYTEWLSNMVLVKKSSEKWIMFVDYIELNKEYPNSSYPLPIIEKLADNFVRYKLLSFMDVYFGYN